MRMNEIEFSDAMPIDGYGPGFYRIGGTTYDAPLVVSNSGVDSWLGLSDATGLTSLANDIDVLLIGMGADIAHIPAELRSQLEEVGIGVEVMSSPQACRTYNVLLGEGRRVAAALLPV